MHTFTPSPSIPYINIIKGVSKRENYFIPIEKHIYDLRFQFPLNFFNGIESNEGHKIIEFDEVKFKNNFDEYCKIINE